MHYRQLTLPILFVLASFSGKGFSQSADEKKAAEPPPPGTPAIEARVKVPEAAEAAIDPAQTSSDSRSQRSPYDYRSTEEISEDRSVSFPVDI